MTTRVYQMNALFGESSRPTVGCTATTAELLSPEDSQSLISESVNIEEGSLASDPHEPIWELSKLCTTEAGGERAHDLYEQYEVSLHIVETIKDAFNALVARWKEETASMSDTTEMIQHPAYQQIIAMGKEAIPLILEELRQVPDHWTWALASITGVDPVPRAASGDVRRIAKAWLNWGKQEGYLQTK